MRVLMISKTFVSSTSQRKLKELAKYPDVELTLVTPPYWRSDDGGKQILERLYTKGYRMIVTPMALNGHFHTYFYPRLGQIMREVRPEIIHIDEEAYNLAAFQAMRLARRQKVYLSPRQDSSPPGRVPALFVAWQNLYRDYPPPFRQIELYNYHHAAIAIAGSRDVAEVLKRKGFNGAIRIIPLSIDPQIYQRSEPRPLRATGVLFTLGYVGRLKEEKGLALLVEALANLPEYCHVIFIGHGP